MPVGSPLETDMRKKRNYQELTKDIILRIFKQEKKPLAASEIVGILSLDKKQVKRLKEILKSLVRDSSLLELKNKRYGLPKEMNLVSGTLWCTRSGNGFIIPDSLNEKDIFVPARYIKNAFHGDRVIARVEHTFRGKKEGSIVKVTQRKNRNIVGFVRRVENVTYIVPEDERIHHHFVVSPTPKSAGLNDGDLVAARITRFPEGGIDPACAVLKVFKGLGDVRAITQFVQYKNDLPFRFRKRTESEAQSVRQSIDLADRLDLRDTIHVTIDGELAKDFDDAVCIEKTSKGFTLYVSIADVSHYVLPGSGLDREAYDRGTSVYFPGTVIPMLPAILSNGICSLNPDEDRLAMTVRLTFNKNGNLITSSFHKSVIRTVLRLTYNEVENALIRKDRITRNEVRRILPALEYMGELASTLIENREKRGSLDFDLPEPDVILDIEGGVQNIVRAERLFAHRIIEEFMIAANEAVATFLSENRVETMYRIHEPPDTEKLKDVERLLQALSIGYKRGTSRSGSLQHVLRSVEGSDYEFLVNRVLLRSMKQARYSPQNKGHFGLASDCYLHFTSPIRRYPDLICHRVLKNLVYAEGKRYSLKELETMANHLSERERLAMEAERDMEDRIRVLFMKDHIGEEFDGVISHIASFGFFVELVDIFVEGLVLLNTLYDDYYRYDEERFRLVGRKTRKIYRIGDKIRIRVTLAGPENNQLHFVLLTTRPLNR